MNLCPNIAKQQRIVSTVTKWTKTKHPYSFQTFCRIPGEHLEEPKKVNKNNKKILSKQKQAVTGCREREKKHNKNKHLPTRERDRERDRRENDGGWRSWSVVGGELPWAVFDFDFFF
jgi:hypothetical protein